MAPLIIDFEKVCRLCLRDDDENSKMVSIFENPVLEETIRNCVQIEVLLNTDEPTNICTSCILSLESWCKFKLLCDNTNAFLQQYRLDKNESDLVFNSDITNLGPMGFTPSQMSDLSISFFESDSLWNGLSQPWNESDPMCTDLPIPRYTKKVQPPEDITNDTISGKECLDLALNVLSKKETNFTYTKANWWNPKAISMKKIQKKNEKPILKNGISKSMARYNQYQRKTYSCNVCLETFTKFNDLILHDLKVHTDMPKNYSCSKCGKLFLSEERVEIHMKVHREKSFACQMCQKKFTQQKTLDIHLNVHIGLYPCDKCDFKAQTMYNLKIHESTHSKVKEHCCQECKKEFSTVSSLRRHNRLVHQKLVWFRCDKCDYSTSQPSNMKYHKSSHDPQNCVCDHCGARFKNQALFKVHLTTHEEAKLICSHCGKLFKKKSHLKDHLNSYFAFGPRIKKFKCDVCEKNFSRIKTLRIHKNKCHPIITDI
ncbi:hypothetical protein AGLY_002549 [Aphis glycines]|uniref:Protein krueppel n=1 Tax=Aphis glycines TaxID=307491 RepID=A0A6G0U0J8_APHGL|nr:hypothetical protein AGLY_002549 [Aphis glycines]